MTEQLKTHRADEQDFGLDIEAPVAGDVSATPYVISWLDKNGIQSTVELKFQDGPIPDGRNGVTLEALTAIVLHRLERLNAEIECAENQYAWANLSAALQWLHNRTKARRARGVEGTREA
ncbi:MAG TPA: hypothetical protein VLE97_01760 [Gaiellaceae bacterium]|nr:hypothetical protein [Gaiellaceae bacterium]